ncbi:MAG: hypothetical protein FD180_80 [Planctomycetota bacterium]|nr:MAG: hypothetical protein FD180_80 [Planctomycetota bacterium]
MAALRFRDYQGRLILLTDERREHVLLHPEMRRWVKSLGSVLRTPERVIRSISDPSAELFYVWKTRTKVGPKYVCAVCIFKRRSAFVVTAYLTDRVKGGETLWPRSQP